LLEGQADPKVAADFNVHVAGFGSDQIARSEGADSLGQSLGPRIALKPIDQSADRGDLSRRVGAERHRTGPDQIDHGRDQIRWSAVLGLPVAHVADSVAGEIRTA